MLKQSNLTTLQLNKLPSRRGLTHVSVLVELLLAKYGIHSGDVIDGRETDREPSPLIVAELSPGLGAIEPRQTTFGWLAHEASADANVHA